MYIKAVYYFSVREERERRTKIQGSWRVEDGLVTFLVLGGSMESLHARFLKRVVIFVAIDRDRASDKTENLLVVVVSRSSRSSGVAGGHIFRNVGGLLGLGLGSGAEDGNDVLGDLDSACDESKDGEQGAYAL